MENTVIVKSAVKGNVSLYLPEFNLRVEWPRKGTKRTIDFEKLKTAMYEIGVERLFRSGILTIDNMEQKIALGLEEPGTTEPTQIKELTEAMMKRMLTVMPLRDFKIEIKKYSYEQLQELAQYAIDNELVDFDKNAVLKEYTQLDILNAIQLKRAMAEA